MNRQTLTLTSIATLVALSALALAPAAQAHHGDSPAQPVIDCVNDPQCGYSFTMPCSSLDLLPVVDFVLACYPELVAVVLAWADYGVDNAEWAALFVVCHIVWSGAPVC